MSAPYGNTMGDGTPGAQAQYNAGYVIPPQQQGENPVFADDPNPHAHAPGVVPGPPPGTAIVQQPPVVAPPAGLPGVPPGLEYLAQLDQILIKQKVELLEAFTGFETNNKYTVLNTMGQPMFAASEKTDCCTRQCCGPVRPFDIEITDNFGNEVIHLERPLRCQSCCCFCCLQTLKVTSPPGNYIGSVDQDWSMIYPNFSIKDAADNVVLKIRGPFCTWSFCGDVEFDILSADGETQVGKITKQWSGLAREAFTDSDNFGASFPRDLDTKIKAVLLGAVFLIDFMFFEKSGNQENDGIGMA